MNSDRLLTLVKATIGVLQLSRGDVLLASFPRSGNTWVRFFFCNLMAELGDVGRPIDHSTVDSVMPELGVTANLQDWPSDTVPKVVKTHARYKRLIFDAPQKVVLLRDPRDVMDSFYHYVCHRSTHNFEGRMSEFIRSRRFGVENWCRFVVSWRDRADTTLRYERLLDDDISEFRRLCNQLDIDAPTSSVDSATRASRFDKLENAAASDGRPERNESGKKSQFFRKGTTGVWRDRLTTHDQQYITGCLTRYDIDPASVYADVG